MGRSGCVFRGFLRQWRRWRRWRHCCAVYVRRRSLQPRISWFEILPSRSLPTQLLSFFETLVGCTLNVRFLQSDKSCFVLFCFFFSFCSRVYLPCSSFSSRSLASSLFASNTTPCRTQYLCGLQKEDRSDESSRSTVPASATHDQST